MPDQINPNGALFGGVLMSWMDKVAYMAAQRHSGKRHVVTAGIDRIEFGAPIHMGDQVVLSAAVDFVGRTSMEVGVRVEVEDPCTSRRKFVASAFLTFVALDEEGRPAPVPRLVPETEDELDRYDEARIRVRFRDRLRQWMRQRFSRKAAGVIPGFV